MVHWPEVMVAYEESEKILFSADAFGKFGTLDTDEEWTPEARRYYLNIVGKFGAPVQTLLKKAAALDIQKIYPLHGPMLTENLAFYLEKYQRWSSYQPEESGILIAYASVYGHTAKAAHQLEEILRSKGEKNVTLADLTRADSALVLAEAFRYDRLVLASVTYDGGLFPCMESFLMRLKSKNYQNRTVGLIENGSWAPTAARLMKNMLENQKNIRFLDTAVTIKSALKTTDLESLNRLADELVLTH
jgi:flavorubredoxin